MRIFSFVIYSVFLCYFSCSSSSSADFEITNNVGVRIDSLKIEPNIAKEDKFIALNSNEKVFYKADMTDIPKVDGAYFISYKIGDERLEKQFGYFSNGVCLEKLTRISIARDSVLFESIF